MQCFSPFVMHWNGGLLLEGPIILALCLGAACGFLWQSPKKDMAYSVLVFMLFCLFFVNYMIVSIYEMNPPYCWGDSWAPNETVATQSPVMWEVAVWNLAATGSVFSVSMIIVTRVKRKILRSKLSA